jgi:hypothetical protein
MLGFRLQASGVRLNMLDFGLRASGCSPSGVLLDGYDVKSETFA